MTVAIGANCNDGNGLDSGHTRVYRWNGSAWNQLGADIDGEAAEDGSGSSVSLSSDGQTVAIGALANDGNGSSSGHTRIYQWNGSAWTQLGADIDGEAAEDKSGTTVSLSSDGMTVAIGAFGNDGNGLDSGHTRIYRWNGSAWTQLGADIDGEAAEDKSSLGLSLSSDGQTVAIGALANDGNGSSSGHTRIYQWNGSAWTQLGADIDGERFDHSGTSTDLSSDGHTIAIGDRWNDGNGPNSGRVRIFHLAPAIDSVSTTIGTISVTVDSANNPPSNVELTDAVNTILETAYTSSAIRIAGIDVTDDELGSNIVTLLGPDSSSFYYTAGFGGAFGGGFAQGGIYLNPGIELDAISKPSFQFIVEVSDTSLPGSDPVTVDHTLTVLAEPTINVFEINGSWTRGLSPPGTLSGSLSVDTETGIVTDLNLLRTGGIKEGTGIITTVGGRPFLSGGTPLPDTTYDTASITSQRIDGNNYRIQTAVRGEYLMVATWEIPNGEPASFAGGPVSFSFTTGAQFGAWNQGSGTLSLQPPPTNDNPTDVTLSNQTVGENQQGATVGTFATVDPDTDDTFTYSLASGAGDGNNSAFYIEGDVLKTATPLDYETTNTANIRVRSTDSGGLSLEKTFTISVSNFNEPPNDIALSSTVINENTGAGARVGQLTTSDPDDSSFGTTFTYALVAGSGDTDNELFEISGDQLLARSSFDYEADSSYSIRLRTTDWPGFSYEEVFAIDVGDVNEAPTSVSLTNLVTTLQSDTNTEAPTLVADIEIQDDALGTNQISLTGDDAGLFTVIDSAVYLIAGATLDPENSPLSFTVVVSDPSITTGGGNTVVRFSTNAPLANPDFLVELTPNTPLTNVNFLSYVNSGAYDGSMMHRAVSDFVIQGGGFSAPTVAADQAGSDPVAVSTTGTVLNEPGNLNTRGTIAMAKLGSQPDSATSQFFFNLSDNSFLDTDNGGYTVFGNVLNDGMTVIDTMASALTYDVQTYYSNTALSDLPLWNINQDNIVQPQDFVKINSVSVVSSSSSVSDSHTIEITAAPTPGPETEFLYSFNHVNEAGADDYLVSNTNMRRYSEWQSPPLTYWGPSSNDQEGQLVYKFPLSGLTTSASLYASSPTWDFFTEPGGYGRGASALEVSNDGETWVSLHNNLEPRNWGGDWTFDDALPAEALGTTELWVRMRFYVENAPNSSYTVAQFGRSTSAATTPAFGLNVTMTTEAPPNTPPTGEVIIFGTAAEDQILSAKNSLVDADGIGPISYQWSRKQCAC